MAGSAANQMEAGDRSDRIATLARRVSSPNSVPCKGGDPWPPSSVCTADLEGLVKSTPALISQSEENAVRTRDRLMQLEAYELIRDKRNSLPEKDVRALSLMVIAAAAGLMGSFLRYIMVLPADIEADRRDPTPDGVWFRRMNRICVIVIGPLLGIGVFWLLESNFLIPLLYKGAADSLQQATVTWQGIGVTSALAGLWGGDLLSRAVSLITRSSPLASHNSVEIPTSRRATARKG